MTTHLIRHPLIHGESAPILCNDDVYVWVGGHISFTVDPAFATCPPCKTVRLLVEAYGEAP